MKRGGLAILILLVVALIVAFLFSTQMMGKNSMEGGTTGQSMLTAVQEAQSVADAANAAMQNTASVLGGGA